MTARESVVSRHAHGVAMVLDHAEAHGLPMPTTVVIDALVTMAVDTLDDLTVWAMYLEEPISSHRHTGDHRLVHHEVRGDALEQPIVVWTNSLYEPAWASA